MRALLLRGGSLIYSTFLSLMKRQLNKSSAAGFTPEAVVSVAAGFPVLAKKEKEEDLRLFQCLVGNPNLTYEEGLACVINSDEMQRRVFDLLADICNRDMLRALVDKVSRAAGCASNHQWKKVEKDFLADVEALGLDMSKLEILSGCCASVAAQKSTAPTQAEDRDAPGSQQTSLGCWNDEPGIVGHIPVNPNLRSGSMAVTQAAASKPVVSSIRRNGWKRAARLMGAS